MSGPSSNYDPVEVTPLSPDEVSRMRDEAIAAINAARTLDELKAARIAHAGDRAPLTLANAEIGALPPQARAEAGKRVGAARGAVKQALAARTAELEAERDQQVLLTETVDVTLPWDRRAAGARHPVTMAGDRLSDVFVAMGYEVAEGPEVEAEWYNFDALNFPPDHPARESQDTLFVAGPKEAGDGTGDPGHSGVVLRTHTSPVQIRAMTAAGGTRPIRIIAPGRTYRSDSDATHTPMFHQVEGLVIDRGIHLGHLKWTLETFLKAFFERDDIVLRLRPSYFPFTEPSAEVDIGYRMVNGRRMLGGSEGWMELLGSGMVHPRVLAACGLDPELWQGFAFGCGIDRLAMLKYGMADLRAFFDGDLRWLRHYGFSALDVPTLSGGVGA